ncbi:MAG TPA: serine/threonine-protein kinase [Mycobacteriales bacterium]|nr:serine/threonine-protein kinase [Mycobacteriales bacterium]
MREPVGGPALEEDMTTRSLDSPVVLAERYELGSLLGTGGVAQVFRARDRILHRDVAVKVFGPGIDLNGPERERAEMRTLAGLSHPNLVPLHDAGTDHDHDPPRAYLVMALVDGVSLAQQLDAGPLTQEQVRDLGAQVAQALAYVHGSGLVHRDVKPANILLDRSGRPFLTDFGIARAVGAAALTAVGDTVGTAAYLSPEQVLGEEVGPAADVYALGLVLLEALTGEREYPGSTAETALARLNRPPRVASDLPAPLRELLVAMTAAAPDERPRAEQVAAGLGVVPGVAISRSVADVEAEPAQDVTTLLPVPDPDAAPGSLPPVDGTRLLTTAVPSVAPPASDSLARAGSVIETAVEGAWARLRAGAAWARTQPSTRVPRTLLLAAAGVVAVLVIVLLATAGGGNGSGSTVTPQPPAGTPGPGRLGPDLDRLEELVQP